MRITLSTGTPAEFAEGSSGRGLVLLPDIGGLRPLFDDHVARLARDWGMTVCAPEPFPGREKLSLEERRAAVGDVGDNGVLEDVQVAAERIGADVVGAMGFCMGGMYAIKAASLPSIAKVVSFYGMIRLPEQWRGGRQREPLEMVRTYGADKILAIIGTEDPWVTPGDGRALEELGGTVVVYEGAEHGFAHDPDRPAHRPEDAADAWSRARAWLSS